MAARFPSQSFDFYQQPQWPLETKHPISEDDDMSVLDDKILEPTTPADLAITSELRKGPFDHAGHHFTSQGTMWHDLPQSVGMHHTRHQSFPTIPHVDTSHQFMRIDPAYAAAYTHPHQMPLSANSGTSTPTPIHEYTPHEYSQSGLPMHYQNSAFSFNHMPQHAEPCSAPPMSPQSSQGGWTSATSSDMTEGRSRPVRSPSYRATSPMSHMRQDGIRKKNARFEIPAERNLHNIDSLILQTSDEQEKKELKQQKRLLRNRQAALDSRQRKKLHTEKLEMEKKDFNQSLIDLETQGNQLQDMLHNEREQWMHERQQYEQWARNLEFERDEAIRTKTLETAELRKMNNILKGHIRDLERQAPSIPDSANTDFSNDFSSFDNLGIDEGNWDDYSLINDSDLPLDPNEHTSHRQPTPIQLSKPAEIAKPDAPFSWNAFYMCLLFGAFIASTSNGSSNSSTTSMNQPSIPSLSDEYRAESANVLKAVLAAGPESSHNLIPKHPNGRAPTTISGAEMARMTSPPQHYTNMDALHSKLITPSRHQQETAAFALSANAYDHLTNPDPFLAMPDADADGDFVESKPTRLQLAYEAMREDRQHVDRVLDGNKQSRSLLWERVPEKVLRDFHDMVQRTEIGKAI